MLSVCVSQDRLWLAVKTIDFMPDQKSINDGPLHDIRSELIRIIYSSAPIALIAILINSVILGIVQWDYVSHGSILIWLFIANGFSLFRLGLYQKFKSLDAEQEVPVVWGHLALFISAVSGCIWGAVAIWLFPENEIAHQVFSAFVLAGMCAGAVTTLSSLLSSIYAFIALCMLPLIGRFLLEETGIAYAMATMAMLFTVMLLMTSKKLNQIIRKSLLLRHEQVLAEETIRYQAYYDSLTDLPNRRLLTEKLEQDISRSVRHKHVGVVLFLDLDHFKTINDSLGHAIGDELLKEVALRIGQRIRKEDMAARLGGDEFILLMSDIGKGPVEAVDNVQTLAKDILDMFLQPFNIKGHEIHMSASIGIALFPLTDTVPEKLLQKSDVAMYEAKDAGRNTIRLFLPEMQQAVNNRRAIEKGLYSALDMDKLELYYQPLTDSEDNITGIEALLRWNHPDRGVVAPGEFIDIAEKSSLILRIGDWVLNTACVHLSKITVNNDDLMMCVNVSPRQFGEPSFVDKVKAVINETGIRPHQLQLEITEGTVFNNIEAAIEKMRELKSFGVGFSIDDFGTGYSSLAYLKRLPVDRLKIDKSFVRDINSDPNDAIIVETIIAMARHMRIDVVAEGVESRQTLEYLKSKGCRKFQGYFFGEPMPFNEIIRRLDPALPFVSMQNEQKLQKLR